ncbi:MAG: dihydrolipoamide acyltransferase [Ruminococcus sp.]|nr:dihydrolipoamide acyltransferase [Ruminococcus sp.]
MKDMTIGFTASAETTATADKLAVSVGSGSLKVFATPMMAALMEAAACSAVAPFLEDGETTVGTQLCIDHIAATPQGMKVTAEAEITAVSGREISLNVRAYDEAGEIGRGTHKRFVVLAEKFQNKTDQKGKA